MGEIDIDKAQNMIDYKDEIFSRPKRTWFQTTKQKEEASNRSKEAIFGSNDEEIQPDDIKAVAEEIVEEPKLSKRQLKRKKKEDEKIKEMKKKQISRKKRRKLELEEMASGKISKSIKAAKAANRPTKFGALSVLKPKTKQKKKDKKPTKKKSAAVSGITSTPAQKPR